VVRRTLHGHVEVCNNKFKKFLFILKIKAINGDPDGHSVEWNMCVLSRAGKGGSNHFTA
jgi:hypothetical protein